MVSFLVKLWSSRYILFCAMIGIFLIIGATYFKGRSDGVSSIESKQNEQRIKDIGKAKKIEDKVSKMPSTDVDRALDKWMRD